MLRPTPQAPIPEETAAAARGAFPNGTLFVWMRDEFEQLYQDEEFADLYADKGQPGWSPWRLALVCIMQYVADLNDRDTADAVRGRIDWKYALGLPLSDPGFHFSLLSEFRNRLLSGGAESRLFERVLVQFEEKGWLSSGGKQRTDSTHVLSTISERSRLEALHECLRAALNDISEQEPEWLQSWVCGDWYQRYGRAIDDYRLPKKSSERTAYIEQIGSDGMVLLEQLWEENAPTRIRQLPIVEHLRQCWVQHFFIDNAQVKLRKHTDMPASGMRSDSPYDPDSRYGNKGSSTWHGYKVHVSETCDPQKVHLITDVRTTPAHVPDIDQTAIIHEALEARGLLPNEHYVDAAYFDAELLVTAQQHYNIELIGPIKADPSWQAKEPEAYDSSYFSINWDEQTVSCPQGHLSKGWTPRIDRDNNPVITVNFSKPVCRDCPVRSLCTHSETYPRSLTLHPQEQQEALQHARTQQQTQPWREKYQTRAGIEGTISQAVVGFGIRNARYRGLAKTRLEHLVSATAINLKRLFAWANGVPHATTRISRFAALDPQIA